LLWMSPKTRRRKRRKSELRQRLRRHRCSSCGVAAAWMDVRMGRRDRSFSVGCSRPALGLY
jgi:hypothetical protein